MNPFFLSIVEYNDKTKIFKPNDIILINDIDEIPKPEYLKKLIDTGRQEKIRFKQKFYYFYLNYRCGNDWTQGTVFIRGKDFTTFSKIRMDNTIEMIVDGGWHFSYMEDPQDKIANLVETEFDLEKFKTNKWLEEIKKTPKDIFNRNIEWYWETDVYDLPMYIKQNLNKYEKFIGVSE